MPKVEISGDQLEDDQIGVVDLLTVSDIVKSKSEARRLINQNGISIDGSKVTDQNMQITKAMLEKGFVLKKGKKVFKKFVLA